MEFYGKMDAKCTKLAKQNILFCRLSVDDDFHQ